MRIAVVGCGYVAQFYLDTLPRHPNLELVAATDRDPERARALAERAGVRHLPSIADVLADDSIEAVVNLTNPASHFEVTRDALEAGKHVYSEKPLALDFADARDLVALADRLGLQLNCAPASLLGETAQTLWRVLRSGRIGRVRAAYAELDDGMVHRMNFRSWHNTLGVPWPYKNEFEVGCTIEHAGYYLTWLVAFFGSARTVTAFSSTQVPDKVPGEALATDAPDFSVACIEFDSGVVARLTCSILAPPDHSLRIFGDKAVLRTGECWDNRSPVTSRRLVTLRRRTVLNPIPRRHRLAKANHAGATKSAHPMDFSLGVSELAAAAREARRSRLPADLALHVTELTLAISRGMQGGGPHRMETEVGPLEPLPLGARR
jgi:predicted dehydrogenase